MHDRIERHRAIAEAAIRGHQALTEAHLAQRPPEVVAQPDSAPDTVFFTPQLGEHLVEGGMAFGATEAALRELEMYWRRIPDFGIKDAKVFASENGWAQALYWAGTAADGQTFEAQEVDIVTTDPSLAIVRFEIYSDGKQWRDIVKFVHDGVLPDVGYGELIGESGSPDPSAASA